MIPPAVTQSPTNQPKNSNTKSFEECPIKEPKFQRSGVNKCQIKSSALTHDKKCVIENHSNPLWPFRSLDDRLTSLHKRFKHVVVDLTEKCVISSKSAWLISSQPLLQQRIDKFIELLDSFNKADFLDLHRLHCETTLNFIVELLDLERNFNKVRSSKL